VQSAVSSAAELRIDYCHEGDLGRLAEFDRQMHGIRSLPEFWRWKYFANPAGPGCMAIAELNGRIVGRLGSVPVRFHVGERELIGAQQVDVAILPEHRRGGVYFQLAEAIANEGARRRLAFGFGFATGESRALSTEFLGFTEVAPIRRWVKVLNYSHYAGSLLGRRAASALGAVASTLGRVGRDGPGRQPDGVVPIERFDPRFERLSLEPPLGAIMVARDAAYLNWKYVDCPTTRYRRYALEENGAPRGYGVFHSYRERGALRGVIDELVCPADADAARLLASATAALAAKGAVNVICWLPSWHPLANRLRAEGFRAREARNFLIVVPNPASAFEAARLNDERNWYYMHGDSDYHVSPNG